MHHLRFGSLFVALYNIIMNSIVTALFCIGIGRAAEKDKRTALLRGIEGGGGQGGT